MDMSDYQGKYGSSSDLAMENLGKSWFYGNEVHFCRFWGLLEAQNGVKR